MAPATPWAATSRSASANTMLGDLPPSSSETRFKFPADDLMISCPTSVLPVKATLSTSSWRASASPAGPNPVTMLTTPSGNPASANRSARYKTDNGVCSAGFKTTQLPVAKATPSFQVAMSRGKFQGMIWPTTPIGSRRVKSINSAPGA